MIIIGSLPGADSIFEPSDLSVGAPADGSGTDFSAMLFLIFATLQVSGTSPMREGPEAANEGKPLTTSIEISAAPVGISKDEVVDALARGAGSAQQALIELFAPDENDVVSNSGVHQQEDISVRAADLVESHQIGADNTSGDSFDLSVAPTALRQRPEINEAVALTTDAAPALSSIQAKDSKYDVTRISLADAKPTSQPVPEPLAASAQKIAAADIEKDMKGGQESAGVISTGEAIINIDTTGQKTDLVNLPEKFAAHPVKQAQPGNDLEEHADIDAGNTSRLGGRYGIAHPDGKSITAQAQNALLSFDGEGSEGFGEAFKGNERPAADANSFSSALATTALHFREPSRDSMFLAPITGIAVVNQIAGEISAHIRANKNEAVITLDPAELGGLKIGLTVDGDKVQAHILVKSDDSLRLIENHLPELKQALRLQHLDLVDVRLDSGNWNGGARNDLAQGFQQNSNDRQAWRDTPAHSHFDAPTNDNSQDGPSNSSWSPSGKVSMWA